jgi:pimeloyl-ACP methyl ester carboxylesterase
VRTVLRAGFRLLSAASPTLAGRLAARIWFRIPRPRVGPGALQFLATGESFDLRINGRGVVAGWRWGSALRPTVIIVHGWGGYGAQFQVVVEAVVRAGHTAVIFDAPSHGASSPGALGPRHATLFEFADVLRELARSTPDLRGIVAHSGGCAAVAWAIASDPALRPPRLVFVAPFARALRYMRLFQTTLGLSDRALRRFRTDTQSRFGFRWEDLEVPEIADRVETPPVLVVHDRDDRETAWQDGADIAARWPRSELVTTSGLGHNRILRDPDVVRRIVGFLEP